MRSCEGDVDIMRAVQRCTEPLVSEVVQLRQQLRRRRSESASVQNRLEAEVAALREQVLRSSSSPDRTSRSHGCAASTACLALGGLRGYGDDDARGGERMDEDRVVS